MLKTKTSIYEEFRKHGSKIRLLFATEAFGMGVDVPDVQHIVHVGSPTNLECILISYHFVYISIIFSLVIMSL